MALQWILTSSILILAVAALGRVLEGRVSARLRYALWLVVLVRLLIPAQLFTAPMDFIPQPQVPEAMEQDSIYVIPTGSVPVEKASEVGAYVTEDGQVGMMTSMGYARLEDGGETVVRYMNKVSPIDVLIAVWKMGAVLMLTVVAVSNLRFSRRLKRLRAPLEVGECKLPVYRVECLPGPCLFGLLRPAIYVTEEVLTDEEALRHMLAHESTHYRHGDHIWSALRGVALVIHWWNPLVWLAVAWSKQDGELACDEGALQRLGDAERTAYGATLLKLVSAPGKPADLLRFTTTMTGGMKEMKRRMERIACKRKHLVILSVALVIILSALAACSFAAPKDENTVSDEARQVIEVMMTAPNDDLMFKVPLGLGVGQSPTEEEKAAAQADSDRVIQNWEDVVGEFFSEKAVISGLNNNWLNAFQARAEIFGKEYAVVDMVQTFKDEKREEVDVTYTADGQEHHILVRLRINTDGKFYEVEFDYADESIEGNINILKGPEEPDEIFEEIRYYTTNAPVMLTMETAVGEITTYSVASTEADLVRLDFSESYKWLIASEAEWNSMTAEEKGTVLTLKGQDGKIIRCCSGSNLVCMTVDGVVRYLRPVPIGNAGDHRMFTHLQAIAGIS